MEADLTIQILQGIRDDVAKVNEKLDRHIDETNRRFDRVDAGFAEMGRRIDQTNRYMLSMEARFATEMSALRADIHDLRQLK